MKIKTFTISALLATGAGTSALAQNSWDSATFGPSAGDWELTLGGSGSNDKNFDGGGFGANGSIGYFLTDSSEISLRSSGTFSDFGTSVFNGSTRVAYDYHFDLDRFRPFVGVNGGMIYGDNVSETGAAGLEAGLKYYVHPKTFLFAMGEYQWLFDDSDDAVDGFDNGQFLYSLGIGFNF